MRGTAARRDQTSSTENIASTREGSQTQPGEKEAPRRDEAARRQRAEPRRNHSAAPDRPADAQDRNQRDPYAYARHPAPTARAPLRHSPKGTYVAPRAAPPPSLQPCCSLILPGPPRPGGNNPYAAHTALDQRVAGHRRCFDGSSTCMTSIRMAIMRCAPADRSKRLPWEPVRLHIVDPQRPIGRERVAAEPGMAEHLNL